MHIVLHDKKKRKDNPHLTWVQALGIWVASYKDIKIGYDSKRPYFAWYYLTSIEPLKEEAYSKLMEKLKE